jgi:hypothetical protein
MLHNTDAIATLLQPLTQVLSSNDRTKETRSPPLNYSGSNTDEPQLSSLPNTTTSTGNSSPSSGAIVQNSDGGAIHTRPLSEALLGDVSGSECQLRVPNKMLLQNSGSDGEGLQLLQRSNGDAIHLSDSFNTNFNNLESHGGSFSGVQRISFEAANIYEVHGSQSVNYNINTGCTSS